MSTPTIENHERVSPDDLRRTILKKLDDKDILEVRITFDGYGDEGQVDDITCISTTGDAVTIDWPCGIPGKVVVAGSHTWDAKRKLNVLSTESRAMTMYELIEEWTYDLLNDTEIDWVNNEGGYGEIVITPADGTIKCELNTRYIGTELHTLEL